MVRKQHLIPFQFETCIELGNICQIRQLSAVACSNHSLCRCFAMAPQSTLKWHQLRRHTYYFIYKTPTETPILQSFIGYIKMGPLKVTWNILKNRPGPWPIYHRPGRNNKHHSQWANILVHSNGPSRCTMVQDSPGSGPTA